MNSAIEKIVKEKIAIVLFNLGGPNSLEAVDRFLFKLFSDPMIIRLPFLLRIPIAWFISALRKKKTQNIYAKIGGSSPILQETERQKQAIVNSLQLTDDFRLYIAMRYSKPRAKEVIKEIDEYSPDKIILLPLYPHFSSTTSDSSIRDFLKYYQKLKKKPALKTICCYPINKKFITAHVFLIENAISKLKNKGNFRILFSAHSLPERIIKIGDPYQWQTQKTVEAIVSDINMENIDYRICYQSKVGWLKWLAPSTEQEITKAGEEKKSIIIVPISFVSEHSETLVELDIDYKTLAEKYDIEYIRVPTLSTNKLFIEALNEIIKDRIDNKEGGYCPNSKTRICPTSFKFCPC